MLQADYPYGSESQTSRSNRMDEWTSVDNAVSRPGSQVEMVPTALSVEERQV